MGIGYGLSYFIYVASIWGISQGHELSFLGAGLIFIVHPFFENILFANLKFNHRLSPHWGKFWLILALPAVTFGTFYGLFEFQKARDIVTQIGIVLSVGAINGILGINVSHELIHSRSKLFRFFGFYLLWLVQFLHWGVEHVYGHHKKVGTLEDPATARRGEGLYSFWIRNYFGGLQGAWKIEGRIWYQNKIFYFQLLQLGLLFLIFVTLSWKSLLFWVLQSIVAILLLLTVDYIEHYGLTRELKEGRLEPVRPRHSWDSYKPLTNFALMNLGYHSHLHYRAAQPFWELHEQEEARMLPLGYSGMIWLALFPPLFKKVMNPLLSRDQGYSQHIR